MNDNTKNGGAPKKSGGLDKIIFGVLIAGAGAVLVYQMFFCATCYA